MNLVEIPAPWRRGPVQAVVVSTHLGVYNVDEPTTQGVGKLPLENEAGGGAVPERYTRGAVWVSVPEPSGEQH